MNRNCLSAHIDMQEYKRTFKYNDVDALVLSIKYPIISIKQNPLAERLINNQIAMNVNDYVRYADYMYLQAVDFYHESQQNDFPFHGFEAYMEYNITYNDNSFLSLFVDKYEYTGGAHGSTIRSSNTWELCSGLEVPLYALFIPGSNYRHLLIDLIELQAEYNLTQNPGIYFDEYNSLIIKNFNPDSFYLTPNGLTIYYQQYDIAPYSTGIVEFTIPYEEIGWYPTC